MKKIICILIALLAFICGVFVFYIRPLYVTIPFYELKENLENYNSHKIKVSGFFKSENDSSESFTLEDHLPNCSDDIPNCNLFGTLELSNEIREKENLLIKEISNKNYQLGKAEFRQGMYGAEVEIVGYVEKREFHNSISDETYFDYVIKVVEIKQIASIRFKTTDELRDGK